MKNFTKIYYLLMVIFLSSTIVFAQKDAISKAERLMMDKEVQNIQKAHGPTQVVPMSNASSRAVGDDCTDPIIVNVPADLPYSDLSQTTCGRGNNYSSTCLGYYDGGEDIIYELPVAADIDIIITMNPNGSYYTGMAIFDACPDVGACLAVVTGPSSTTPKVISISLVPGNYFIMVDTWPSPTCIPDFDLTIEEVLGPDPIVAFPFTEDWESGAFPGEMEPVAASRAHVYVSDIAAHSSSYGVMMDGDGSSGWSGGSTSTSYSQAFNTNVTHHAFVNMIVNPIPGEPGLLKIEFDMRQNGSFGSGSNWKYSWFRLLVDGVAITDELGNLYYNPQTDGDDPWQVLTYDLTPYQGLASFDITLQTACKYYYGYSTDGDCSMIDNLTVYYELPPGAIDGYVMNGLGLTIAQADVAIADIGLSTQTSPTGYYYLGPVPVGTWDVSAAKDGYNTITDPVTVYTAATTYHEFILTQPSMIIQPLLFNEVLHPNQYLTEYMSILNTGDGPLDWTAEIIYPPSDGETNPIHVPAFTGEIEKDGQALSIKAAPENTQKGEIINPVYLDNILGDNDGWIGAPSDDKLYVMDMGTYTSTLVGSTIVDPCSGDFLNNEDQIMHAAGNWGANLYEIDVATGAGTLIAAFSGAPYNVSGMATDRTSGTMYVCGTNVSASYIGTLDVATGVITQVGSNITNAPGLIDIAIDGSGQMYGWCIVNDASYTIDKTTGIATTLGSLGFNANYGQGGNWDQNDDVIYLTAYNSAAGAQLRALDPVSGATVLLSGLPATQCAAFGVPGGGAGGGWLTLSHYEGTVPPSGGTDNVGVNFNAEGFVAGDYVTADIVVSSDPDVGTITIPVSMTVLGFPFIMPYDLEVTLMDLLTGEVYLTWSFDGDAFLYFIVYRDGVFAGSTTDQFLTDILPDYGEYCYTVVAVYDEGQTAPAGPECVEWFIPDFCWYPAHPEEWVWTESEEFVDLIVTNCGQGMLEYTFPEYVALDLVNDPNIEQNQIGDPFAGQETTVAKGENDPRDNGGYPIVLGAGGPDDFGYVWIDSDEAGGPAYEWFEISAIGTDHGLSGDDNYVTINIPFTFEFYGDNKTSFKASTNGYLTFGSDGTDYSNDPIPSTTDPDDFLAAFWDDLNFTGAAKLYSYHDAANNRFIVQYTSVPRLGSSSVNTFQYHLYESNGRIAFMYQDMNGTLTSATTGIENVDGSVGLQVAYNTSYVHDNLAVMISLPAHFIIDVVPAYGALLEGESETVVMTYSSVGYGVGDYDEDLECLTNALAPNDVVFIPNTMHVYQPAEFAGTVTDGNTGAPIGGVEVTAGTWQTMTAPDGTYSIVVDPDSYDVYFEIVGFQDVTVFDTTALAGVVTPIDVEMFEEAYPPGFVTATVNDDDTQCLVEWGLPAGPYEIIYDDGSADDYFVWSTAGNANAVKFTPAGYPATVIGGKIYVGDGSFPVGANFLGTTFGAVVYDDDGEDGLPGTQLDSVEVTVDNYGWVDFSDLYAVINDGDFFIAMFQGGTPPNAAPVGIDYTIPTVYRSYSYDAGFNVWALSAYQDFMIRAIVSGPQSDCGYAEGTELVYLVKPVKQNFITLHVPKGIPGYVKAGEYRPVTEGVTTDRDVVSYTVARLSNFDPNGSPLAGDITVLATGVTALTYNDAPFAGLSMGWYAYCVRALYTNGDLSDCAVSNIVGHLMNVDVTINVTLSTGDSPEGTEVALFALDYPYDDRFAILDATGTVIFEDVWKGMYDLSAFMIGYDLYFIPDNYIFADEIFDIMLLEKKYTPYNLYVDPLTSIATWSEPMVNATSLNEDFNGEFPPDGWQMTTNSVGWFATMNGSSTFWTIPTWTSQYVCANDDAANGDGSVDYLITPPLDLRDYPGYSLKFDSYFNGAYSQLAFVEYSLDAGATWELVVEMIPSAAWESIEIDLSAFSGTGGQEAIWFAFHADDNGVWASGWAIDNVEISAGSDSDRSLQGYHVFLDGGYVAFTEETTYTYHYLTYGVEYEASVGALYSSGLSEKDYYTFISEYLIPPRNLQGMSPTGTDYAYLVWLPPVEPATAADYTIVSEEIRTEMPNKNSEYSPTVRVIEGEGYGRDQWDVQYNFPAAGGSCEAGTESDGSYIYSGWWNGAPFYKYELDGTYLGEFTISGVSSIRDYAYDGQYFYGAAANTSVRIMDFDNQTLIGTINAPTACRAIAYDEVFEGFWGNNWSTDIVLFDMDGLQLNSFPVGAYGSFYGFAYDNWTEGGPYLWGQSQDGSGAEIVQIEIATGAQISNFNVLPIVGGTQIAGGMYSHCGLIDPGLATLGGVLQCELLYGLELVACGGPSPATVPENLIGFNTYRDGVYQDYVEWIPGNANTLVDWYDFGLLPSVYEYAVTAVYDLEPYGLPGETAESMKEGPVNVTVTYGYELPFFEAWESGTFEFNEWTTECDNWRVNGQIGNPLPSAEFQWDPLLTDYECGLISYPLLALDMIDGDIWLDFDLMLDSRFDTAVEEKFIVKVWENGAWYTVAEFINEGDMDWTSNHIDITSIAKGADFRLGFFATGLNSVDIIGWYIDNIHVYRLCAPPFNLIAEHRYLGVWEGEITLSWTPPGAVEGEWISYNDGTFENAFASTAGGAGIAQVFTPPQYPCTITKVRFFVSGYLNYYQDEEVYVLTGDGATILAGPYVVPGVEDDWVTVDVDDVTITEGTFMVATFNVLPDGPFIGVDDSYYDATLYFGTVGDFTELGEWGYFFIGSHEAYVEYAISDNVVVNSVLTSPRSNGSRADISESNTFSNGTLKPNRDLIGYNVFRNDEGGIFEQINDETVLDTTYVDTTGIWGELCYYVTAVYDQCESDSSNNACVYNWVGIEELTFEDAITVYPNPASDFVNVVSTENITKITVINYVGQIVYEKKVSDETNILLNTASYETGVYMIKIETDDVITVKRVTIMR